MSKISIELNNRNWKWLFFLGLLFVILSFFCLSEIIKVTMLSVMFIGIVFLIAGCAQILDVFTSREWEVSTWHGINAVIYLAIGGLMMFDPALATSVITLLIGISLVVIGILRLVMALSMRVHSAGWFFMIINSLVAIVMGLIIITLWPNSSMWVIGLVITIELMISGLTYILLSLAIKNSLK